MLSAGGLPRVPQRGKPEPKHLVFRFGPPCALTELRRPGPKLHRPSRHNPLTPVSRIHLRRISEASEKSFRLCISPKPVMLSAGGLPRVLQGGKPESKHPVLWFALRRTCNEPASLHLNLMSRAS